MATRAIRPRVGVLALTLELYETLLPELRPGRQQWLERAVLPMLGRSPTCRSRGPYSVARTSRRPWRSTKRPAWTPCVVICLTYSPSQIALPALRRTRLPIVIWNTQELLAVGRAISTAAKMIDNHGVHGTQDLANVLVRSGVPFQYVTSHLSDAGGPAELADFFAAAAAVAGLRRLRGWD